MAGFVDKVIGYVREVRTEMRKVAWSPRQELINSTSIVLVLVGLITTFIFVVDSGVGFVILRMLFQR